MTNIGDLDSINRYIQRELRRRKLERVTAVEAAKWLNERGLLRDSPHRPGLPLRRLLRKELIRGAWQESGRWWFIGKTKKGGAEQSSTLRSRRSEGGRTRLRSPARPNRGTATLGARPVERRTATARGARLDRAALEDLGFEGFVTFKDLRRGRIAEVPNAGGIYVVLREAERKPSFLQKNPGGGFKGRDPSVGPEVLRAKWIGAAYVIYIGKGDNLRRRLTQFMRFGSGEPVGHWGGRYTWQVAGSERFVVAWRQTAPVAPRTAEIQLLVRFVATYGRRPFANLTG
jgi:hypothetical protein